MPSVFLPPRIQIFPGVFVVVLRVAVQVVDFVVDDLVSVRLLDVVAVFVLLSVVLFVKVVSEVDEVSVSVVADVEVVSVSVVSARPQKAKTEYPQVR